MSMTNGEAVRLANHIAQHAAADGGGPVAIVILGNGGVELELRFTGKVDVDTLNAARNKAGAALVNGYSSSSGASLVLSLGGNVIGAVGVAGRSAGANQELASLRRPSVY